MVEETRRKSRLVSSKKERSRLSHGFPWVGGGSTLQGRSKTRCRASRCFFQISVSTIDDEFSSILGSLPPHFFSLTIKPSLSRSLRAHHPTNPRFRLHLNLLSLSSYPPHPHLLLFLLLLSLFHLAKYFNEYP